MATTPLYFLRLLQRQGWRVLAAAGVALTVVGFYQPWAELDVMKNSETEKELTAGIRRGAQKAFGIKGKQKEPSWIRNKKKPAMIPTRINGAMIPTLAHRKNVKVLLQLAALVTREKPQHDTVGRMSYAVYAVPGLAAVLGLWLIGLGGRWRWWGAAPVAALGLGIAGYGGWTLLTTQAGREYGILIGPGLWLTLAGYAALAAAALLSALPSRA